MLLSNYIVSVRHSFVVYLLALLSFLTSARQLRCQDLGMTPSPDTPKGNTNECDVTFRSSENVSEEISPLWLLPSNNHSPSRPRCIAFRRDTSIGLASLTQPYQAIPL